MAHSKNGSTESLPTNSKVKKAKKKKKKSVPLISDKPFGSDRMKGVPEGVVKREACGVHQVRLGEVHCLRCGMSAAEMIGLGG